MLEWGIDRPPPLLVDGKRRPTARREPLQLVEPFDIRAAVLERPKLRRQRARRRLEQKRNINVIGAEPHAMPAQDGPQILVETLKIVGNLAALKNAERFHELVSNAAGQPRDILGGAPYEQRRQQPLHIGARPQTETAL